MLTSTDAEVLRALDDMGGSVTGAVARRAKISYGFDHPRQRSHAVRSWLMVMKKMGLVEFIDDQKPVAWRRTRAGTEALKIFDHKSR